MREWILSRICIYLRKISVSSFWFNQTNYKIWFDGSSPNELVLSGNSLLQKSFLFLPPKPIIAPTTVEKLHDSAIPFESFLPNYWCVWLPVQKEKNQELQDLGAPKNFQIPHWFCCSICVHLCHMNTGTTIGYGCVSRCRIHDEFEKLHWITIRTSGIHNHLISCWHGCVGPEESPCNIGVDCISNLASKN